MGHYPYASLRPQLHQRLQQHSPVHIFLWGQLNQPIANKYVHEHTLRLSKSISRKFSRLSGQLRHWSSKNIFLRNLLNTCHSKGEVSDECDTLHCGDHYASTWRYFCSKVGHLLHQGLSLRNYFQLYCGMRLLSWWTDNVNCNFDDLRAMQCHSYWLLVLRLYWNH